jgi:chaperonin GroES
MKTQITPLGLRVIVKPYDAQDTTSFGLVLSDSGQEKPMEGEIISISSSIKDCPIAVGDRVLFKKYSPTEFKQDNQELFVLDLEDVLAKIG